MERISSESEYQALLNRIEVLMDAQEGTPELLELKRLTLLVEAYEDEHYPIAPPKEKKLL